MPLPDINPRLVQREVVLLVALALVASVAFVFTREVAKRQHDTNLSDAAEWFAIGERQLDEGHAAAAVASLRHASSRSRDNRHYTLTLARALAANGQVEEARTVLLALREIVPDDPDVSIALARLAAARQDVTEAQRFYQNALYGIWTPGREDERLRLRVELIRLLLQHEERGRALSEVVALSTNLADTAPAHTEAGQLFLAAGDPERALDQFSRALELSPEDDDALAGAGEAAFLRGDYAGAQRYFSRASALSGRLGELSAVARLVLTQDPLAPRLTLAARRSRLEAAVSRSTARLEQCLVTRPAAASSLEPLHAELARLTTSIDNRALRDQPELVDHGVDLVYRAQRAAADACGEPRDTEDRALLLVGERHRGPA
ncbi:MAG: tetratricopeptide repeat protein [Acidobacteria bacterium]|nr:tetratricopeptide repeat protein [Acidobacteriota bacterium]